MYELLTVANPKTRKGNAYGYHTGILHLAPSRLSGREVCPKKSVGCSAACLNTAGFSIFYKNSTVNPIQAARIRRTKWFFQDRTGFLNALARDIAKLCVDAKKRNKIPAVRLNGTSDIAWEKFVIPGWGANIFQLFSDVQFYDYTKILHRNVSDIPNLHLTFSRSESNQDDVATALKRGMNVAVVFDKVPPHVYNADQTDLRFLDPHVGVIGLRAKGLGKSDSSGFVVRDPNQFFSELNNTLNQTSSKNSTSSSFQTTSGAVMIATNDEVRELIKNTNPTEYNSRNIRFRRLIDGNTSLSVKGWSTYKYRMARHELLKKGFNVRLVSRRQPYSSKMRSCLHIIH